MIHDTHIRTAQAQGPRYIAIEGVIGAGKTTIASMMAQRLNARLILEQFEDNPFLPDFYRSPERYAFQTQIFFLLSRFRQQQGFRQLDLFYNYVVSDYIFDKDRIFASLTLNENEMRLYDAVVSTLEGSIPKPDLVVYLQSNLMRVAENIRNRARPMEKDIPISYLRDLSDAYTKYFFHYTSVPVLIVNTAEHDFVNHPVAFNELLNEATRPSDAHLRFFHLAESTAESA